MAQWRCDNELSTDLGTHNEHDRREAFLLGYSHTVCDVTQERRQEVMALRVLGMLVWRPSNKQPSTLLNRLFHQSRQMCQSRAVDHRADILGRL